MIQTFWQKFTRHYQSGGLFYAFKRGWRYLAWRTRCAKMGIDWRKFAR